MVVMSFKRAKEVLISAGYDICGGQICDTGDIEQYVSVYPDEINGEAELDGIFSAEQLIAIGVWMTYPESVVNA